MIVTANARMLEKHFVRNEQTRNRSTKKQMTKVERRKKSSAESISTHRVFVFDGRGERVIATIIPITRITWMRKAVRILQFVIKESRISARSNVIRHNSRSVKKLIQVMSQDLNDGVSIVIWIGEVKRWRETRKAPTRELTGNGWKLKRIAITGV